MEITDTVLIVDDSLTVRMDLADAFAAAGFAPVPCATVAAARAALADASPVVVLLDVRLPDGDGIELLQEIRTTPRLAPAVVVMLSSEVEVQDRVRGLQTGADEYVGKPYDLAYLVSKVRQLLESRRNRPSPGTTILIIDDSETFREALGAGLADGGHHVLSASTGEDGLRIASAERPDVIVVDGVLPGIDGTSVIRHVRLDAALRDIPCVLLTGADDTSAELRALDAGADTFIRKEEDLDVITARLSAVLRRASSRTAIDEKARSLLGPKKILAVDDSPTYLDTLMMGLQGEGYDVILARSGEQAIEMLAVQPVDCILLDLIMPGLGGHETCRRIKSAEIVRDIPLIMLTGLEDRQAMIEGLRAGADDYVSKSSELDILKARVRAQMRRKQFEDENRRIREELLRKELEAAEARAARTLAETRAELIGELERKNRELEAFSSSVSHDLRAPLRSIDGFSRLLVAEEADRLSPKARDYLTRVCDAAQRMREIIEDLLELSRVSSSDIRRRPTDLSELARGVVLELRRNEPERRIDVQIDDNLTAVADSRLMKVVLENLIGNSWKFTMKTTSPTIHVGSAPTDGVPHFFVRDNGAGFDMSYAGKLFQPFQRLHSLDEFPGTGIGLATVQRIIERHGGRVSVFGAVGQGATISFTLPSPRPRGVQ